MASVDAGADGSLSRVRESPKRRKICLASLSDAEEATELLVMDKAYRCLLSARVLTYHGGLHDADIAASAHDLSLFICWFADAAVRGISRRVSGGKHNHAVYYQVGGGGDVKFQAHKLSACTAAGLRYTQIKGDGVEASHLCHRHECWNPSHITLEGHAANMARNSGSGCAGWIYDRRTDTLYKHCVHEPACRHILVYDDIARMAVPSA